MMKYAIFSIIFSMLLFGCTGSQPESNAGQNAGSAIVGQNAAGSASAAGSDMFDCGTDKACFYSRTLGCQKVKGEVSESINILGAIAASTTYFETRGIEDGKCILYRKIISSSVSLSDSVKANMAKSGMTAEQISDAETKQNALQKTTEGKDSTCKYPLSEFDAMITGWSKGSYSFSTGDWAKYECTGTINSPSNETQWVRVK